VIFILALMEIQQAIALIKNRVIDRRAVQVWADLGCGDGLFTRALATQLAAGSTIYAVDQNKGVLQQVQKQGAIFIKPVQANFVTDTLPVAKLDGILMANALHFVQDQSGFIKKLQGYLSNDACFIMVEYDTDVANRWVPYPLSFTSLQQLFKQSGYATVKRLHEQPSLYGRANIYSAIITK
jgi:trans-aconitate methyltransferase